VIAAAQAGIKRVMLPARNQRDFGDIPEEVRKQLEFIWIDRVDEAVSSAFRIGGGDGKTPAVELAVA